MPPFISKIAGLLNAGETRSAGRGETRSAFLYGRAFSLVEVVMALGIVVFCIISILSLFSVGLRNARDSEREMRAGSLVSSIIARMRAAPTADLTAEGVPFGPLTNAGGALFQVEAGTPWYLKGDGTLAPDAETAMAAHGYAMLGEGSFNPTNQIATVAFTLWWPAAATFSNAAGKFRVATFIDTTSP